MKKKARKGQKPDLKFISKETYKNQGKVNFELLVGEVCSSPWEEKQPKMLSDLNKMIKMMKDCKDLISSYFYNKYRNDSNIDYNNNDSDMGLLRITEEHQ
ncbi:19255_t:CDS:2 [Entrophospora sp. SA101]|nr:19255_t:CDS:2 [Entrophospora sp. SA101]